MNLLLAGGTGLVGNEVLTLCLARTHHVTSVGRRPTGRASREIVAGFSDIVEAHDASEQNASTFGNTVFHSNRENKERIWDTDTFIVRILIANFVSQGKLGIQLKIIL